MILGSVSGILKHIKVLLKSTFTHVQNLLYPWLIKNPEIFNSATVFRSLSEMVQAIMFFTGSSFLGHFRCLAGLGSVSGTFRHIQALFKSILKDIQDLVYLCHIQNPAYSYHKGFYTVKYIHNTILNIFTKAPS